jgi:hypothetical protein
MSSVFDFPYRFSHIPTRFYLSTRIHVKNALISPISLRFYFVVFGFLFNEKGSLIVVFDFPYRFPMMIWDFNKGRLNTIKTRLTHRFNSDFTSLSSVSYSVKISI